mmetsp:Transcript_94141/g.263583  ORF Transcript_94141/g.263583 Transcript_94141/m.263583 type:complete len:233 (+) Transcript_94141:481-1179(+)
MLPGDRDVPTAECVGDGEDLGGERRGSETFVQHLDRLLLGTLLTSGARLRADGLPELLHGLGEAAASAAKGLWHPLAQDPLRHGHAGPRLRPLLHACLGKGQDLLAAMHGGGPFHVEEHAAPELVHDRLLRQIRQRRAPGGDHVDEAAEGKNVGGRGGLVPKDLRSHPASGAAQPPHVRSEQPAQAEVEEAGGPLRARRLYEDVAPLDVAVDDDRRLRVQEGERAADVVGEQ